MKFKTFQGYWKTAEEEQQRAVQQAQDAMNAMTPEEVAKMRHLLMAWTRIADMTVSEFVGGVIDAHQREAHPQMDIDAAEAARATSNDFRFMEEQE